MRKKYVALFLACVLGSSLLMSGCGSSAVSVPDIEEDEEDEEDEAEVDDDDENEAEDPEEQTEEVKPSENVIVKEIDEDDLYSQIEIFIDNRDVLFFPESDDYAHTTCMVCDLDYNGRCELILTGARWYGAEHESRVYEINEEKDGVTEPGFAAIGIDSDLGLRPDFSDFGYVQGYFDKQSGTAHYLISDNIPENPEQVYGTRYCDVSLHDGTFENNIYGKYEFAYEDSEYVYTYFEPNGEVEKDEFTDYIDTYGDDRVVKRFTFGIYEGDYYFPVSDGDIETMDSDKLTEVLADSYKVFSGSMDFYDFQALHCTHSNPYESSEELLRDCVGTWGLCLTDTEGDVTYYEPEDEFYMMLDVYEDGSIYLQRRLNTDDEEDIYLTLEEYQIGMLRAEYAPDVRDDMAYSMLELVITEINLDGMLVISTSSWYGSEYISGSNWYFERLY